MNNATYKDVDRDLAHEADMRALRKEQLEADYDPEWDALADDNLDAIDWE